MTKTIHVTEFLGDGISVELSRSLHRVAEALPVAIAFRPIDLGVESRRAGGKKLFDEGIAAINETKNALKYPTATTPDMDSPNKILRERCHFSVIHRPVVTIPSLPTRFQGQIDLDIVRIATGGTYEDPGHRIGYYSAVSIRVIERIPCRQAARFAFELARKKGKTVTSASKYTIQKATDGLFEEAVDDVAKEYPDVQHNRELFDALLYKLHMYPEKFGVVVTPNEYGDFLSDMACGMIGSLGLGDSASYSFTEEGRVELAMFDPVGGTAPDIAGQNLANPTAALFSLCSLLVHADEVATGTRLKNALLTLIRSGQTTRDLQGTLSTDAFTEKVIETFQQAGAERKDEDKVAT